MYADSAMFDHLDGFDGPFDAEPSFQTSYMGFSEEEIEK